MLNGWVKWIHHRPSCIQETQVKQIEHGFEPDFSTPSGHSQAFSALTLFLSLKCPYVSVYICLSLFMLWTGLSRIYLGIHYVHDVMYGWILGITFPLLFFYTNLAFNLPLIGGTNCDCFCSSYIIIRAVVVD
jgi:membrane-associated phospholipid phosphatase